MFRQTRPSIWEFIDISKLDASHSRLIIAHMLLGAAPPPHKKKIYRDVNARIATLLQRYNNGNTILSLCGISYHLLGQ